MIIISPQDVKKLREETNAGFGDCKKALSSAGGDFELAKKKLREMGIASAEKRLDRDAKEGRVFSYSSNIHAGLLLVSCETDFVALNHNFVNLGNSLIKELVESGRNFLTTSQESELKNLAATIKENIQVKKIFITEIQSNEFVKIYLHGEQSKIGVLVKFKVDDFSKTEDKMFQNFAMDLALHVAAFAPIYLRNDDVCPNYIKEQEEIFAKQLEFSGKSESIVKGIVAGKIKKHFAEISLLEQSFVKNDKITVREMLEEISKAISSKVEIVEFKYLRIG